MQQQVAACCTIWTHALRKATCPVSHSAAICPCWPPLTASAVGQSKKVLDDQLGNAQNANQALERDVKRFEQREKLLKEVCSRLLPDAVALHSSACSALQQPCKPCWPPSRS